MGGPDGGFRMGGAWAKDTCCGHFRKHARKMDPAHGTRRRVAVITRQTTVGAALCAWDDSSGTPEASTLKMGMLAEGCA